MEGGGGNRPDKSFRRNKLTNRRRKSLFDNQTSEIVDTLQRVYIIYDYVSQRTGLIIRVISGRVRAFRLCKTILGVSRTGTDGGLGNCRTANLISGDVRAVSRPPSQSRSRRRVAGNGPVLSSVGRSPPSGRNTARSTSCATTRSVGARSWRNSG